MSRPQTTVYVSGLAAESDESTLIDAFQPFGEIVEVHLPKHQQQQQRGATTTIGGVGGAHRGFGFVQFSAADEAEAAIDNMHLNEIGRRVVTVTLAKQPKAGLGGAGRDERKPVWADEEWIKQYGDAAEKGDSTSASNTGA